jgi:hypothetical protein
MIGVKFKNVGCSLVSLKPHETESVVDLRI